MENLSRSRNVDVAPRRLPELYERIGYDPRRESEALRRVDRHDPAGCRESFRDLLDRLDLSRLEGRSQQVIQLLVDALQKVNRRVHHGSAEEWRCQRNRMSLIEVFAGCGSATVARDRFLPALDRLLEPLQAARPARHPLVERATDYIRRSYQRRISLSRVAEKLNVSPNYLSRLFRRETGVTLTAFIQRTRLDRARTLLAERGPSISEIAYRVGYQTYRDFYRNFVKYEKASPREVRRRLHGESGSA